MASALFEVWLQYETRNILDFEIVECYHIGKIILQLGMEER